MKQQQQVESSKHAHGIMRIDFGDGKGAPDKRFQLVLWEQQRHWKKRRGQWKLTNPEAKVLIEKVQDDINLLLKENPDAWGVDGPL